MYLAGGTVLWVRLEVTAAAAMALADSVHAERGETERAAETATQRGTEDRDRWGSGACAVLGPTAPDPLRETISRRWKMEKTCPAPGGEELSRVQGTGVLERRTVRLATHSRGKL